MSFLIDSQYIAFHLLVPNGIWQVNPPQGKLPSLKSAPISIRWHDHQDRFTWVADGDPQSVEENPHFITATGSNHLITMMWDVEYGNLKRKLEYALSDNHPSLLWRLQVTNQTGRRIYLDHINLLHTGSIDPGQRWFSDSNIHNHPWKDEDLGLSFKGENPEFAFYTNGWQSWNYAGTLDINDPFPWSRLGFIDLPARINAGTPRPKRRGHFVSDFFAIFGDRRHRVGFVLGFLSQRQLFGTIEGLVDPDHPTLRMWANLDGVCLEPDQSYTTDWAYLEWVDLNLQDPLAKYFEAVAVQNDVNGHHVSPIGWCSWYHAFESVSEKWMLKNISWASLNRDRLPFKVLQLDDGYQENVGDWLTWKESFPEGIEPVCAAIREADFTPGIWIAPFVAKRRSEIGRSKPEWILRNRFRLPVNPGFLWDSFPYVLDVTHPGVIEHIQSLIRKYVHEMGFEYLKCDFLYAGALPGIRHDRSLTRAQALYRILRDIREIAGDDTELLGCGCPLGSGIGVFDVMRIGPDVAPDWKPYYRGIISFLEAEKGLPSARNAILTTINRLPMHDRWWVNDPDCLIVRSTDTRLSEAEVKALASVIAMSGGALVLSDDLPSLTEERIRWFAGLIPPLSCAARAIDWFDTSHPAKLIMDLDGKVGTWKLITLINWADQPSDLVLSLKDFNLQASSNYHLIDFWDEQYHEMTTPEIVFKDIEPHGVCMLSLKECLSGPQWLGDTLHISQGLVVEDWQLQSDHLIAKINTGRVTSGKVWLALESSPKEAWIEDEEIAWEEIAPGIFQFLLHIDKNALFRISW